MSGYELVMNMLKDKRMFDIVEETLKNNGKLSEFEKMATAIPPALDGGLRLPKA